MMVPRYHGSGDDGEYGDNQSVDGEGMDMPPNSRPWARRMYIDMYLGRGKEDPPVTLRLSRLEDDMNDVKAKSTRQERLAWSILVGLLMVFAAVIFKR